MVIFNDIFHLLKNEQNIKKGYDDLFISISTNYCDWRKLTIEKSHYYNNKMTWKYMAKAVDVARQLGMLDEEIKYHDGKLKFELPEATFVISPKSLEAHVHPSTIRDQVKHKKFEIYFEKIYELWLED